MRPRERERERERERGGGGGGCSPHQQVFCVCGYSKDISLFYTQTHTHTQTHAHTDTNTHRVILEQTTRTTDRPNTTKVHTGKGKEGNRGVRRREKRTLVFHGMDG